MNSNLTSQHISQIVRQALEQGLARAEDTALLFHDLGYLRQRIEQLKACFPPGTLHGLAIKANPLLRLLEWLRPLNVGVEAATMGEVRLALHAGYPASAIVYDSPVKTREELEFALETGVHLNIDNLSELERVAGLKSRMETSGTIGIRINPQVGLGSILGSSVAGEYSKFGVPIRHKKEELRDAFRKHPWLTGVHLHVGSQGCPLELLVEGAGVLYDFACWVNEGLGCPRISIFDIGGGLPVSYSPVEDPAQMLDYVGALKKRTPALFQNSNTGSQSNLDPTSLKGRHHRGGPNWSIITEFGRWVFVNSGFTISRVEYVKKDPGIQTAMIHVGADLFLRECLNPSDWQHEYSVLDKLGNLKSGRDSTPYNLAGPLCFSGDILAKSVSLPPIEEGDYIVIHDSGGYTFSMWSRYNSRYAPRILGFEEGKFTVLKERESFDELVRFWT